jgi:hypothetical protein
MREVSMTNRVQNRTGVLARLVLLAGAFITFAPGSMAQPAHQVPFASSGNVVELLLENSTGSSMTGLKLQVSDLPSWIRIAPEDQVVDGLLLPGKPITVSFAFAVDKSAPVGTVHQLAFRVSSPSGERWTKSIPISVLPPRRFELLQNYPNPFNPSTTIAIILPSASEVVVKVYNVLGEEVATPFQGMLAVGYHETVWEAQNEASGVYFYRLIAPGSVLTGRMMLLR